jgi:hypothetical protein
LTIIDGNTERERGGEKREMEMFIVCVCVEKREIDREGER